MLLLTGAIGMTARHVVHELRAAHAPLRLLLAEQSPLPREELDGVDVVSGALADGRTVDRAMRGVRTLLLLTRATPDVATRDRQLVEAARRHGVTRVLKVSVAGAGAHAETRAGRLHAAAERLLAASDFDWAVLRMHRPMQHLYAQVDSLRSQHTFYGCQGAGAAADVDVRDVAAVIATLAAHPVLGDVVHELTGPTAHTAAEVAAALGAAMDTTVRYVDCAPDDFVRGLLAGGMPRWHAEDRASWQHVISTGRAHTPTDTVARLLGRAPRTMPAFAAEFAAAIRYASPPIRRRRSDAPPVPGSAGSGAVVSHSPG